MQLGAFKDQKNADSLAKKLRDDGFPVEISPINRAGDGQKAGAQQHELFVTEASVDKVNTALKGRGRAQPAGAGVVVTPALSLEDAVTESKRLADQGLKVVIRPAGAVGKETSPPGTLYVVRAGGFPDRARALTAREELSAKGHGAGFLAQGPAR